MNQTKNFAIRRYRSLRNNKCKHYAQETLTIDNVNQSKSIMFEKKNQIHSHLDGNRDRVQLLSIEQVRIPASWPISSHSILFSGMNDNPVTKESCMASIVLRC